MDARLKALADRFIVSVNSASIFLQRKLLYLLVKIIVVSGEIGRPIN
jgi:hypothetical protein